MKELLLNLRAGETTQIPTGAKQGHAWVKQMEYWIVGIAKEGLVEPESMHICDLAWCGPKALKCGLEFSGETGNLNFCVNPSHLKMLTGNSIF